MRVYRGSDQVLTGGPIPLAGADDSSTAAIHPSGRLQLLATLAPGDYALELSVTDHGGKRPLRSADAWVDFTTVK